MGTHTPTPVPVTTVSPPYPNPPINGPVNVDVWLAGDSNVSMDVFTTAFRKVVGFSNQYAEGKWTLTWDLKDKFGNAVSNGLYYLRIQVTGPQPVKRIFKVLVVQ